MIFIIVGIHLLVGLLLYFFATKGSIAVAHQGSWGKIIYLIVNRHPVANSVFGDSEKNTGKYWVNGSSLSELTKNIEDFSLIEKGRAIVLLIGLNDLTDNEADEEDLQIFFVKLPAYAPIICIAIPPVDDRLETQRNNAKISAYNQRLKKVCGNKENCSFIDLTEQFADENGSLKTEYRSRDGIFFNSRGNQILNDTIESLVP